MKHSVPSDFEKKTEDLRQKVIVGERKLRLKEVEDLTDTLTNIGKMTAGLKGSQHYVPKFSLKITLFLLQMNFHLCSTD